MFTQFSQKYLLKNVNQKKNDRFLDFLAIETSKMPDKNYEMNLIFSGDIIIKLINNYCKDNFNPFPLANSSSTSLFQIYEKLSHDKFKVTFNGEGSDEHFGGYTRYNRTIKYIKSGHKFNDAIMKTFNKEIELLYSVLKKEKRKFKNRIKSKIKEDTNWLL